MKKSLLSFAALLLWSVLAAAQAPVPTSWDFENFATPPVGWSFLDAGGTGVTYSAATSCGSQALRMDWDNDQLMIVFGQQPGSMTFSAKSTGNPWGGIFKVQESTDSINWVNMVVFNSSGAIPNANCTTLTVNPSNPLSRYYRFWYEDKISGSNVAIDDVSIAAPVITQATLLLNQNSVPVFSGAFAPVFTSAVGTALPLIFNMKNIGTVQTLNVDSIKITGAAASDFSVTTPATTPVSITPNGISPLSISFNPSTAGSRIATLHIYCNDPANPDYSVVLFGAGNGLATEPSGQASGLTFPVNKTYRIIGQFNTANPPLEPLGGYLVLRSNNGPVTDLPADGQRYLRGQSIGNSKVVFCGPVAGNSFSFRPTYIHAGKTYHFAVFTFNGADTITNYNTNSPLTGSVATPATMMPVGEYTTINTGAASFISDLTALINPHQSTFYSNYVSTMINRFETRDTFTIVGANIFNKVITCSYSNTERVYSEPFDWTAYDFSREHTYAHTWMPSYPADNPEKPEYNDQHHLYPTRQSNVNELRCNYPFGDIVTPITTFGEGALGLDINGNRVYEPRDKQKGRVARALMYIAVCYNGINGLNWKFPNPIGNCSGFSVNYGQNQEVLKNWHFQYPPDSYDIARNDFLDSLQGNRNPFVDMPEYACYIDFSNMTKINNPSLPCNTSSLEDGINPFQSSLELWPNPANTLLNIRLNTESSLETSINIHTADGRQVFSKILSVNQSNPQCTVPVSELSRGIYFISVSHGQQILRKAFIKD
jgi:endonuclease I